LGLGGRTPEQACKADRGECGAKKKPKRHREPGKSIHRRGIRSRQAGRQEL